MTAAPRLPRRRGDGSAAVRGWVAIYTFGLPAAMRDRRIGEMTADLAEERLDSVRRGRQRSLFRQRMVRLLRGVPADLMWRVVDAPVMARDLRVSTAWVPLSRWTLGLIGTVVFMAAGGLMLVAVPAAMGQTDPDAWVGWGPIGYVIGSAGVLVGVAVAIPWPVRGAIVTVLAAAVGFVASPWLWGGWLLAIIALAVRWYELREPSLHRPSSGAP